MVAEYFAGAFALCVSVNVRVFVCVLTKVDRCGCNGCSDGLGSADMCFDRVLYHHSPQRRGDRGAAAVVCAQRGERQQQHEVILRLRMSRL